MPKTVYRLATNSTAILLVTVCWNRNAVTLTMINENGSKGRVYPIQHQELAQMCLDSNWVKKPVPGMVLDEQMRLFISWSETYCVRMANFDTPRPG